MTLSKSLYTRAIQCQKALWLKKYKKEVLTTPDESALAVFEVGNEVGGLACELFKGGKEVPYSKNYDEMIATTKEYLDAKVEFIYEATFRFDGILVMVDVLHVKGDEVSIYEVKSSTSLKEIYLHDCSIQHYVLQNLGFNVKSTHVVHIDSSYVRGDELELDKLFSVVDVSQEVCTLVQRIPSVLSELEGLLKKHEPNIEIGKQCNKPYECDAKEYCWKTQRGIPEYSMFNIFNLGSKKQIELYKQGIVEIADVPETFEMTQKQAEAVANYKSQKTYIDKKAIKEFCDTLSYPIYYLDFETYQQAIPLYKGIKPFEQIPFQYSLHVEHSEGSLEHYEFLAEAGKDAKRALAQQLVKDIPLHVNTLAYNMSFEKGVIKRLAEQFEDLHVELMSIHDNMKDLMVPFQKKHFVSPSMKGSYSIKYVLPALVPQMQEAYKKLDGVQNGGDAMRVFASLHVKSLEEQNTIREQLKEYCKLDTLAMVKVLEKLKEIIE